MARALITYLEGNWFKPTRLDPDFWIRGREGRYDYIGTHTDNVLVIAVDPTYIFEKLKKTYKIKSFGPSVVHLGCNYVQVKKGDVTWWVVGSTTYIAKCLRKVCALLKVATLRREKFPCRPSDHNELDFSTLLSEAQHHLPI